MIVKEIINHTPYTIGFIYGNKTIIFASCGVFNTNHSYDRVADESVIRIVDYSAIVELSI